MHPKRAARFLASIGGMLLLLVLLLRGFSIITILDEKEISQLDPSEAQPIQRNFSFSEEDQRIIFQQGLASISGEIIQAGWFAMALDGGSIVSAEPPPNPEIRPFLLQDNQLFILVGEGVSLATGSPPGTQVTSLSLSPDGEAMAFAAHFPDGPDQLYVLYKNEDLVWLGEEEMIKEIAWSPDGEYLAYLALRSGTSQVLKIDSGGSHLEQLTFDNTEKRSLIWLKAGLGIAYIGTDQSNPPVTDIYLVSEDRSSQRRLTDTPQRELSLFVVGNGEEIAYAIRPENQTGSFYHLNLMNLRSGQTRQLYPPYAIESFTCPQQIPRGGSREVHFELLNSSLLPAGIPIVLRSSSTPLLTTDNRQANAVRIETVDVPPGGKEIIDWSVRAERGLKTYVSVLIDLGDYFPMAEQHCIISNTYLGLPNLPFLPAVLPLSVAGMLLTVPWLRHQKNTWLWVLWMAYPIIVIVLIAVESAIAQSPDSLTTIFMGF